MVSVHWQNARHVKNVVYFRQEFTGMVQVVIKELVQTLFQLGESLSCMTIRQNNWPITFYISIYVMFSDLAFN